MKAFFCMVLSCLAGLTLATTFTVPPKITESDGKAFIAFTVSDPIDVEVAVLSKDGKVVRHLAAGVLGADSAPPAPLVKGLSQSLTWDGLDDYGNRLYSGPFRVRVRLGVTPVFERRIHLKDASMLGPTYYAPWNDSLPLRNGRTWGPDTVIDTSEIIPATASVLMNGTYWNSNTGLGLWDGGTTQIDMSVSKETDELIFQHSSGLSVMPTFLLINGLTGLKLKKWVDNISYFGEPVIDWFGRFFLKDRALNPSSPDLTRMSLYGIPMNYSWGTNKIDMPTYFNDFVRQPGFCNDQYGNIFQAHNAVLSTDPFTYYVSKSDSVGKSINDSLIMLQTGMHGLRVDMQGNIFIAVKMKPLADTVPKPIRGLLSGTWNQRAPFSQAAIADEVYGSIVKFGPQGGTIALNLAGPYYKQSFWGNKPYGAAYNRLSVTGAKWVHYGSSFVFNKFPANDMTVCGCYNPRFDVDRFGRVIYPDIFNNCFRALDNNGNQIFRVHNRDLFPNVRMGSVVNIQASDRRLYLGDHVNNQVVALTWKADVETSLTLVSAGVEKSAAGVASILGVQPNPFNPSAGLNFALAREGAVELTILDSRGRTVRTLARTSMQPGVHSITWDGCNDQGRASAGGVYFFVLKTGNTRLVQRAVMMK